MGLRPVSRRAGIHTGRRPMLPTRFRPGDARHGAAGLCSASCASRGRIPRMSRPRGLALAVLTIVTGGSLAVTGGYAWYLRSDGYRARCEETLSRHLDGVPVEIGRVVPRGWDRREFRAVRVWLPERRDVAAYCEQALVVHTPTAEEPDAYELHVRGGQSEISARTWLRDDYRFMLETGLRPGFDVAGPRRIVISGFDLVFQRNGFRAALDDTSGVVAFESPERGRAALRCKQFNGCVTSTPVTLAAEFSRHDGEIRFDRVALEVPELPVATLGLRGLTRIDLRTGSFAGRLTYRETESSHTLTLHGVARGWPLAECTAGLAPTPWQGVAEEIEVEELMLTDGQLERVRFHGVLTGVRLADLLAGWGLENVGGDFTLRIEQAELSPSGLERLVARGECRRLALTEVSRALGWGQMSGAVRITLSDLTISANRLRALAARIELEPPDEETNWIERNLLLEALTRATGVHLPDWLSVLLAQLPDRLEYTQLGVRLEVEDELLYVFGTHGPRDKALLTLRVNGQELPALFEPEQPIALGPLLDELRSQAAAYLAEQLDDLTPEDAWRTIAAPAAGGEAPRAKPE